MLMSDGHSAAAAKTEAFSLFVPAEDECRAQRSLLLLTPIVNKGRTQAHFITWTHNKFTEQGTNLVSSPCNSDFRQPQTTTTVR